MTERLTFFGDPISGNCYKLRLAAEQYSHEPFIATWRTGHFSPTIATALRT